MIRSDATCENPYSSGCIGSSPAALRLFDVDGPFRGRPDGQEASNECKESVQASGGDAGMSEQGGLLLLRPSDAKREEECLVKVEQILSRFGTLAEFF